MVLAVLAVRGQCIGVSQDCWSCPHHTPQIPNHHVGQKLARGLDIIHNTFITFPKDLDQVLDS